MTAGSAGVRPKASTALVAARWAEFIVLFFGLPLVFALEPFPGARNLIIPALVLVAAGCLIVALSDHQFPRRSLWNAAGFTKRAVPVVVRFVIIGAALTGVVLLFRREMFLSFPGRAPVVWLLVMILYPLLSVYPQELVFRAFLFHRYQAIFPKVWQVIAASAVSFGFAHIVFLNWVSVALTVAAGVLFAWTFHRTQSLLVTAFEHALYGCLIFTVGLGDFFYHGTQRVAQLLAP